MNYEQVFDEIEKILNNYYPIYDFEKLSDQDSKRYKELTEIIKQSDNIEIKRRLDGLQMVMSGSLSEIDKFDSDIAKNDCRVVYNQAKKAVDMCIFALNNDNITQLKMCITIYQKALHNLDSAWGAGNYPEQLKQYISNKAEQISRKNLGYITTDFKSMIDVIVNHKMRELNKEITKMSHDIKIFDNEKKKKYLQERLEQMEFQYFGTEKYKKQRENTEGKSSKELFIICKDIINDKSISNEEFSNIMLLIENRWSYLSKKLEIFKKNNIADDRVQELTEELVDIESLETEFLRAKYLQDGKIKLEQSSNVYGPHHIKSLEVKLKGIEKTINGINNSIQHEQDIINGNDSFRRTNGVFNATDLANTKKDKGNLQDKLDLYELEKESLNIILQKNDEIINGLTNKQLEDLNEWKNVFMGWFDVLSSTFDVEFKNDKIPNQIKSGQISVANLKEILEKKSSNLSEFDKVEFEEEVEYKCSVYDNYKKIIEEFDKWSKANTATVDLAYLFNELEEEQKEIISNNVRNL